MQAAVDWDAVDVVLLDMDGTVLDLAFDNFFWHEAVPRGYADVRGLSIEAARAELQPEFDRLRGTLAWYSLEHWSKHTGLDLPALKRECRERIAPAPGAMQFLERMAERGLPMWLVTNADPTVLDIKLMHTGLESRFERIVTSHEFDAPKEDAAFWTRFQSRHPFVPAKALFVDDSEPVLAAARGFGIGQVVGIRWPDSKQPARDLAGFESVERLVDLLGRPGADAAHMKASSEVP